MKQFIQNIVGSNRRYDLTKIGQSYTLNMFTETVDSNENYVSQVLRPIPGYKLVCNIPGRCRGIYTVSNGYTGYPITYAVYDDKVFLIQEHTHQPYLVGEIAYGSDPVHFCETGNSQEKFHAHLVIADGNCLYAVDTQISPARQRDNFSMVELPYKDYENGVRIHPTHCCYLYGYLVVNDKDTDLFYVSYQFPWERDNENNTLDDNVFQVGSEEWGYMGQNIQSYWSPDNTTALICNGSRLYTFGKKSFQMFQYTNDLNVPFNSPDTCAKAIGLRAKNAICQLGTSVMWLGSNDIGNNGIYLLSDGMNCTRVSTPEMEREIASFSSLDDCSAQIWSQEQHTFAVFSFPSAGKSYCYDIIEGTWSERCSLDEQNNKVLWRYNFACLSSEGDIWQSFDGGIAKQVNDYWLEHDGTPILRLRRGGVIQTNYENFVINSIEVMTNNGQYEHIDNGKLMMRYSVDGGTWTDSEIVDIGAVGNYDYDCVFYNFGLGKCFTIELSNSQNIPFALYGLKIDADVCCF